MKRGWILIVSILLVFGMMTGCGSTGETKTSMTPGVYTAEMRGYVGMINVETTVDSSKIIAVKVLKNKETVGIGSFAVEYMPDRIVKGQSIAVDTVSGATMSSKAILGAVTDTLQQANANMDKFKVPPPKPAAQDQTLNVDVVVVGAGGAGLAAGVEARNKGKNALIIDKMDVPGGNTIRSSGEFNVAGSPEEIQAHKGRYDVDAFVKFTMDGGHNINNRSLVELMIKNSYSVVEWLKAQGMDPRINETYTAYFVTGEARGLILALAKRFESLGGKIMYGVRATDILMKDGQAVGIKAHDKNGGIVTINAKAVVLATGGFGYDVEWCARLDPKLKGFVTNNSPSATGDGMKMADAIGAQLIDMEQIQIHPTIHQASSTMLTEAIRNSGGILLNTSGKRFTNEVNYRDVVSAAILSQDQKKACLLFNKDLMGNNPNVLGYLEIGLITPYQTLDDVAKYMGVDPAVVKDTVATWNSYVAQKNDPEFQSAFSWIRDLSTGPYFALWVAPGIHHTMGGVKIDEKTEVISNKGAVIPGLFAAGEVTGGVHGGNRIGGNAILDTQFFGRTAGDSAAAFVQ